MPFVLHLDHSHTRFQLHPPDVQNPDFSLDVIFFLSVSCSPPTRKTFGLLFPAANSFMRLSLRHPESMVCIKHVRHGFDKSHLFSCGSRRRHLPESKQEQGGNIFVAAFPLPLRLHTSFFAASIAGDVSW